MINYRVRLYIERKLKTDIGHIDPADRQDIIAVLREKFEYTPQELMALFDRARCVIYRDISTAEFIQKRVQRRINHAIRIYGYILYNARYIP